MKKRFLLLGLFFCFFLAPAFAAIANYTVPNNVPLNQELTIYGVNDTANVLCAFFIFDLNDQGQAIIRLSDEYSFADGSFYSEYTLTEPEFRRGKDYNAVTKCGSNIEQSVFRVIQKEDIAFGISPEMMRNDFAFWLDSENSLTVVFFFFVIIFCAGLIYTVFK